MLFRSERFLRWHWSPEQIQHRLRHENSSHTISYSTIYRGIYAKRFNDPNWVISGKKRLRHRGKKRRRKGDPTRDNFPVVHALSERPPEAQARARIGDWEADTVAGVVGKQDFYAHIFVYNLAITIKSDAEKRITRTPINTEDKITYHSNFAKIVGNKIGRAHV